MLDIPETGKRFLLAAVLMSLADMALLGVRILITGTARYWFVPENLALAWLSLAFAWLLVMGLQRRRWLSWQGLGLTALWLLFLPNTWYVLTDFIHVYPNGEISQLFDIVLMSLLVFTGFALGIASLAVVHGRLGARQRRGDSWLFIETAILVSSFAVYLGRDLRWNSWDVITHPTGLLVNISDPFGSQRPFNITILFFFLVNVVYLAYWTLSRPPKHR